MGIHGHPRATKDADFLVGKEAFVTVSPVLIYGEELREIVREPRGTSATEGVVGIWGVAVARCSVP